MDPGALAQHMFGERIPGQAGAFEGRDHHRPWPRGLRYGPFISNVGLDIVELHLQLFNQPGMRFCAVAILFTPEFGFCTRRCRIISSEADTMART